MELENLRREYLHENLSDASLDADPLRQFELWLQQAIDLDIPDPTAMVLATVDEKGQPSQRIVLLKHVDADGFVFFTNYASRKAQDIAGNRHVSLLFPWHSINRQVKVSGSAEKIPVPESLKYFISRPRESQLAAWASKQSAVLPSRQFLLAQLERMKEKFGQGDIPLPDFWGGYRVRPACIEFWQGAEHRLHDRFQYSRRDDTGAWHLQRLAP